jgi:hypothetical protein
VYPDENVEVAALRPAAAAEVRAEDASAVEADADN